jgi:hypothetical protein
MIGGIAVVLKAPYSQPLRMEKKRNIHALKSVCFS